MAIPAIFTVVRMENAIVPFELLVVMQKIVIERHNAAISTCIAAIFLIFFLMSGVSFIKQRHRLIDGFCHFYSFCFC